MLFLCNRPLFAASCLVLAMAAGVGGWWIWGRRPSGETASQPDPNWFRDVTTAVGIDFTHDPGDLSRYWQAQIHGSGAAVFDFDGDGRLDLYFLNFGGPGSGSLNRLFKNMPDGTFQDVTAASGLGIDGYNTGVIVGDVNNDGKPDVLVTQHGGVRLFLNQGDGKFTDITEASGLKNPRWGTSANFVDYDRDGWLDLVIVNYLDDDPNWRCYNPRNQRDYCGPTHFPG
ncbi:MAG: VCBS repeat-containing protein, partial [Gemmataceae bacterium]|nr:VCBS repeat-containing protein [Gemmataceae bacterium]